VHTPFPQLEPLPLTWSVLLRWLAFAVAIALTSVTFVELIQLTKKRTTRWLPALPLRLFASGLVLIGLWQGIGSSEYLGLGVPTILRAFHDPSVPEYAFLLKLVFTVVTVGCGFLGGEVTPLFFIGATLGNTLGQILGLPLPMSAAVGLIALFAAASNTPLALSIMAVELFGGHVFPHVVIVCLLAYVLTGHRSIYPSQRVLVAKSGTRLTKLALLVHKGPPEGAPAAPPPVDGN
jgi:H+/Cl- antiporter ClcA